MLLVETILFILIPGERVAARALCSNAGLLKKKHRFRLKKAAMIQREKGYLTTTSQ